LQTGDWLEKGPVENHVGVKFCASTIMTDGNGIEEMPVAKPLSTAGSKECDVTYK
jgi:hypothetical protein